MDETAAGAVKVRLGSSQEQDGQAILGGGLLAASSIFGASHEPGAAGPKSALCHSGSSRKDTVTPFDCRASLVPEWSSSRVIRPEPRFAERATSKSMPGTGLPYCIRRACTSATASSSTS